jgi:beta-lactamase class A
MKNLPSDPLTRKSLKKLTIFSIMFLLVFCGLILVLDLYLAHGKLAKSGTKPATLVAECPSNLVLIRKNDQQLTHPLLLVDVESESPDYRQLKGQISGIINGFVKKQEVQSVSVYLRELTDASWMNLDGDRSYFPGSLMKVPIMICYLKQEHDHPGILNKELLYVKPKQNFPSQVYRGDSILSGRKYKISELLRYMIEESDNNATFLLSKNLSAELFRQLFIDLNIPPDEINDINYKISPRDYAKFFRVLYSSTYLDESLSQYALELLSHCKFMDGMVHNLPHETIVARKFGEHGADNVMDFSEAGIVYKDGNPYLLVIMTEGSSSKVQADLISKLSETVFKSL